MWSIPFTNDTIAGVIGAGPAADSNSAPYYDFSTDTLYVGTDKANIHQFTGIFGTLGGTPAETVTVSGHVGWPVYMNPSSNPALTGPIEDEASGRIFVADSNGVLTYIETGLGPTTPAGCYWGGTTYPCLSDNSYASGDLAILDPPIVDSSLGTVMIFQGHNSTTGTALAAQFPTTTCVCGADETGGMGAGLVYADFGTVNGGGIFLHDGDFDNNYYNNTGPGTVTGFMYVCAIDPLGVAGGNTALRQISFDSNGLITGTSLLYLQVGTDPTDECSPVTEVYNPTGGLAGAPEDLMFFSVRDHSVLAACGDTVASPTGGCLMSVDVTTGVLPAVFSAFIPEDGGTSGIVVDNVADTTTYGQASSIYFTPLGWTHSGTGNAGPCTFSGCAIKATQNGLN